MLAMFKTSNAADKKKRSAQYLYSLLLCRIRRFKAYSIRKLRENMWTKQKAFNMIRLLCFIQKSHEKNNKREFFDKLKSECNVYSYRREIKVTETRY